MIVRAYLAILRNHQSPFNPTSKELTEFRRDDYIVKHTVGKLVEGKTPQQVGGLTGTFQPSKTKGVRPLTVLDPACGSGSFLLGAYQFLLDWYRDRYLEDGPETHAAGRNPRLFQRLSQTPLPSREGQGEGQGPQHTSGSAGEWRLTTAERKRILLSHIHGVDIDSQAVETTKLSLLLKVLEGESAETIGSSLRLFHERALPDLAANIKCGNSLIGPDFYDNRQMGMFDEEERYRINVFDWQAEFPEVFDPNRARKEAAEPNRAHDPNRARKKAEKAATPSPHAHRQAVAAPPATPLADGRGSEQPLANGRGSDWRPLADGRGSDGRPLADERGSERGGLSDPNRARKKAAVGAPATPLSDGRGSERRGAGRRGAGPRGVPESA